MKVEMRRGGHDLENLSKMVKLVSDRECGSGSGGGRVIEGMKIGKFQGLGREGQ